MDSQALRIAVLQVLVISVVLITCKRVGPKLPYYSTPDFTPQWIIPEKDTLHTVSEFTVTDQDSNQVSLNTYEGKIFVANFFFTSCPGICPKMTNNLKQIADSFKNNEDVKLLSFSVTPERDSVKQLKNYATDNAIDAKQWRLVTGNKAEIYTLARKSFFAEEETGYNADSTEFLHTEHVLLVDKDKHLRGVYNGTVALEMKRLKEDIQILLQE